MGDHLSFLPDNEYSPILADRSGTNRSNGVRTSSYTKSALYKCMILQHSLSLYSAIKRISVSQTGLEPMGVTYRPLPTQSALYKCIILQQSLRLYISASNRMSSVHQFPGEVLMGNCCKRQRPLICSVISWENFEITTRQIQKSDY
jgi:hypothetical protein